MREYKIHFKDSQDNWPKCGSPYAELQYITNDKSKVTCKNCLRLLGITKNNEIESNEIKKYTYIGLFVKNNGGSFSWNVIDSNEFKEIIWAKLFCKETFELVMEYPKDFKRDIVYIQNLDPGIYAFYHVDDPKYVIVECRDDDKVLCSTNFYNYKGDHIVWLCNLLGNSMLGVYAHLGISTRYDYRFKSGLKEK